MRALPEEILTLIVHSEHNTEPQWKAQERYGTDLEGFRTWLTISRASFADLKTFCFVSKAFKRISQPLLYRKFDKDECLGDSNKRMRLFLRTILEDPKLGLEVEEVSLGRYDASMGHRKPSSDLARLYNGNLRSFSSLPNDLYEDLSNGSEDAEVVLLLSLCPNIQALSFTSSLRGAEKSWLGRVLLQHWAYKPVVEQSLLAKEKRILPNLQHLSFEHYESEPGSSSTLDQLKPFLHLPHLQHLSTDIVSLQEPTMRLANNAAWPLLSITLQNTIWSVPAVSSLLHACPSLESLSMTAAENNGYNNLFRDVDFQALGVVLRQHGTALRSLTIDARSAFGYGGEYGEYRPLLGSLKPLVRLEHLRVPLEQLLEHEDENVSEESIHDQLWREVLPESITNLELLDT